MNIDFSYYRKIRAAFSPPFAPNIGSPGPDRIWCGSLHSRITAAMGHCLVICAALLSSLGAFLFGVLPNLVRPWWDVSVDLVIVQVVCSCKFSMFSPWKIWESTSRCYTSIVQVVYMHLYRPNLAPMEILRQHGNIYIQCRISMGPWLHILSYCSWEKRGSILNTVWYQWLADYLYLCYCYNLKEISDGNSFKWRIWHLTTTSPWHRHRLFLGFTEIIINPKWKRFTDELPAVQAIAVCSCLPGCVLTQFVKSWVSLRAFVNSVNC